MTDLNDDGRVLTDRALVSDQAPSGLAPTGFDPSRNASVVDAEVRESYVGQAIEAAWNGSGSGGRRNDLPPINLTGHEQRHLGAAAIRAVETFDAAFPNCAAPTIGLVNVERGI